MRISDWSSDVCSSDLVGYGFAALFLRLHDDAIFLTPISVGGNAPGAEKCLQGFADVLHRDAEIAGAVGVYRNVQLGLGFLVIAIEIDDSGIIRGGGHEPVACTCQNFISRSSTEEIGRLAFDATHTRTGHGVSQHAGVR